MNIALGILIGIGAILLIIMLRVSTTFFHELGHALSALIFTNKSVEVYIGSYGDISKTTPLNLGRLRIFFRWNIFDWKIGMCRAEESLDADWKRIVMILGGPIASLLISISLFNNLTSLNPKSLLFFISIIFIAVALADFVINMVPFKDPIVMHDGAVAHSDGYALLTLIKRQFLISSYFELEQLYLDKDHEALQQKAGSLLTVGKKERFIYEFMIKSYKDLNNNNNVVLSAYKDLERYFKLNDHDYFNIGKLYRKNGNYTEALKYYKHFYFKCFSNVELLEELGITHIELGNNEAAIKRLNTVIEIAPEPYHAIL